MEERNQIEEVLLITNKQQRNQEAVIIERKQDPLHFSNIPSNFGDETVDLIVSPYEGGHFHQNVIRKVSDQEYDRCDVETGKS
jgi:hypothetical protein